MDNSSTNLLLNDGMTRRHQPRPSLEAALAAKQAEAKARRAAETELDVAVGRRLRWARELVYATSKEFSKALGIAPSTYHMIEHGKRSLSTLNLVTAANKLLVGTEYLLTGDLFAVEASIRRELIDRHPELLHPGWVPDPTAPKPLLVPHRVAPTQRGASEHKDTGRPPSGKTSRRSGSETPPEPTKRIAVNG